MSMIQDLTFQKFLILWFLLLDGKSALVYYRIDLFQYYTALVSNVGQPFFDSCLCDGMNVIAEVVQVMNFLHQSLGHSGTDDTFQ